MTYAVIDELILLWNIWDDSLVGEARAFNELNPIRSTLRWASAGTVRLFNEPELLRHGSHDVLRLLPS